MALVIVMNETTAQQVASDKLRPVSIGGGEYIVSVNVLSDVTHSDVHGALNSLEQRNYEWPEE